MAVCVLCSSLDDSELFQEALRELSRITEDVSVLYKENSTKIEKIKKLNEELEEFLNNQLENMILMKTRPTSLMKMMFKKMILQLMLMKCGGKN